MEFEAYRVKVETLLEDVKTYIKSRPQRVDYRQINIGNIGRRLVYENQRKYVGERVAAWDLALKPRPAHFDRRVTVKTPLKQAGAFLLTAKMDDGNLSRIIIWISDTVLLQKRLDGRDFYFVADAVTGRPIPRANVEFFGYNQKRIAPNKYQVNFKQFAEFSDANGQVIPPAGNPKVNFQWLVTARGAGNRLAFLGFRRAWFGRRQVPVYDRSRVYAITDRPVYRPGQVAKFKFWIRNARYDKPETSLFAERRVTILVTGPRGKSILKKEYTTDAFGGLDGEVALPADAQLGNYRIVIDPAKSELRLAGRAVGGGGSFRVEEYKKPEFEVSIESPTKPIQLGEKITATITAKYLFGAPVTKAKVKYKVLRYDHRADWYPQDFWDWCYSPGYWWFGYDYTWYPGWGRWGCMRPMPWWWWHDKPQPEVVAEAEMAVGPDGTLPIEIDTAIAKEIHGDKDHRYEITVELDSMYSVKRYVALGYGVSIVPRRASGSVLTPRKLSTACSPPKPRILVC